MAAIAHAPRLERLAVDEPMRDIDVISGLGELRELDLPVAASAMEGLEGHRSLRRLSLHFGTHRDLGALESCPRLADIEIWQIQKLTASELAPVARVRRLDALALGTLRHVTTLRWLDEGPRRLRFLSLERLPALESFEPMRRGERLTAFGAWDSRPADRRLAALHWLPLEDVVLGDVSPADEVNALLEHSRARARIRGESPRGAPDLGWRMLFEYADWYRQRRSREAD